MIRLLIKDYTLQEKMELYDSLGAALSEALYWLEKQIRKDEMSNAQNR